MNSSSKKATTVIKALEILEELSQCSLGLSNKELSSKLSLHPSTSYRLLKTLSSKGYVKNKDNKYKIGSKLLQLQYLSRGQTNLKQIAYPILSDLSAKTELTVNLAVLEGLQVVIIDIIKGTANIAVNNNLGKPVPPHASSVGKVILASLPLNQKKKIVDLLSLKKFTPNTITDPDKLLVELQRCKDQGHAIDNEEFVQGIRCIGAPICPQEPEVKAAISVSTLTSQIEKKTEENLIQQVKHTAKSISSEFYGKVRTN